MDLDRRGFLAGALSLPVVAGLGAVVTTKRVMAAQGWKFVGGTTPLPWHMYPLAYYVFERGNDSASVYEALRDTFINTSWDPEVYRNPTRAFLNHTQEIFPKDRYFEPRGVYFKIVRVDELKAGETLSLIHNGGHIHKPGGERPWKKQLQ